MTDEQFTTIYRLVLDAKCAAGASRANAKYDWQKKDSEALLRSALEASEALLDAYNKSAMLRGKAPCPECGEYVDLYEMPKEEEVA